MQKTQDWEGLRGLWRGLERAGAVLAMAFVGAVCGGFTAGAATICIYGLGLYVGLPVGAGLGAWLGMKIAPRDAVLVFGFALLSAWVGLRFASARTDEGLALTAAWGGSYVVGAFLALRGGVHVPERIRHPAAVVSTWGMSLFFAYWVVRHLWFSD